MDAPRLQPGPGRYAWPAAEVGEMPDDLDEAASALGLLEVPFPTFTHFGGPYAVRRAREGYVDHAITQAARAARWLKGARVPPSSLGHLVDAVQCQMGLGPFDHPHRMHGIRARNRAIPKLYELARRYGLGELRNRATIVAASIERGLTEVPSDLNALLVELKRAGSLRLAGSYDLDALDTGRGSMTLGGQVLRYARGKRELGFSRESREGTFLVAAARGRGAIASDPVVRAHVVAALRPHGVRVVRVESAYATVPELRVLVKG